MADNKRSMTRRVFGASALALGVASPGWASAMCSQSPRRRPDGSVTYAPPHNWSEVIGDLPVRTQEIYPGVLDGRVYLAGGLSPDNQQGLPIGILDDVFVGDLRHGVEPLCNFDVFEAEWTRIASLPEPRHHPNLVGHVGAIFAIGGFRAGNGGAWEMLTSNTRYDPDADAWREVAPLPQPYGETVAASLNGAIHVVTGRQPNGSTNANWNDHGDRGAHYVYDAGEDRWREAMPNPNPRNSAAGAVLEGRLHVVGGRRVNAGNNTEHEAYDPASDRWITLAPLPQGQGGLAAAALHGKLYAFGGEYFADEGGVYPQTWVYDPEADNWEAGPDMRSPRHGLGGVVVDQTIYAIGGALQVGGNETSNIVEALR